MPGGMSTLDWAGLVVPFVVYLLSLVVYYVWEGRREKRIRRRYDEEVITEPVEAYKLFWLAERPSGDVVVDSVRGTERPLDE